MTDELAKTSEHADPSSGCDDSFTIKSTEPFYYTDSNWPAKSIKRVIAYRASTGQMFDTRAKAVAYEMKLLLDQNRGRSIVNITNFAEDLTTNAKLRSDLIALLKELA